MIFDHVMHVWWFINVTFCYVQKFFTASNNDLICLKNLGTDVSFQSTFTSFKATFKFASTAQEIRLWPRGFYVKCDHFTARASGRRLSLEKLSRRLSSLENKTALSEGDKVKAREILSSPNAVEYMSSEESDPGDTTEERSRGPKPRKIKKLSWERSKLKNIKEILNECYLSGLNAK